MTGVARRIRLFLSLVAGAALLVGFARLVLATPALLLAAAALPAAVGVAIVLRLDRRAHTPGRLLLGAFLWGAVVAPAVAAAANGALRLWFASVAGAEQGTSLAATFGAPLVEEGAKAVALAVLVLAWRDDLRDAIDGIVYGALIGIGFTLAENLYYFAIAAVTGGEAGLAESVYLRAALGGVLHPTFTATIGAGIGWGRAAPAGAVRWLAPLLGFVLAVLQHAAWNGLGAGWLDGAACGPGAAAACQLAGRAQYWLLTAPVIVIAFVGPGLVLLAAASRRDGARRR